MINERNKHFWPFFHLLLHYLYVALTPTLTEMFVCIQVHIHICGFLENMIKKYFTENI